MKIDVAKLIKNAANTVEHKRSNPNSPGTWEDLVKASANDRYAIDDDAHEAYTTVGVDGLLAASEKVLAVSRGVADEDDRDSLNNDRVYTTPKLMAERVKLDTGKVLRSAMGRFSHSKSLNAFQPDMFGTYTVGYLKGNPLASPLEEINPMQIQSQQVRITKMGPGGIGDSNAITESMQSVHGSQFGFIDVISGPESEKAGIDVRLATGARVGSDGRIYQQMRNTATGKLEWVSPTSLLGKRVRLPD